MEKTSKTVRHLKIGEAGTICGLSDPAISLKLLEMGCIPGAQIKLNSKAPFGCPVTVVVNDYILSLRLEEAETIELT